MDNEKELLLQDTRNRNKVFYVALWITYLLTVMSVMQGTIAGDSWFIFAWETVMMAVTSYSLWKRRWASAFVYIGMVGVGVPIVLEAFHAPNVASYFSIYLLLVYASLYMNWIPLIAAGTVTAVLEIDLLFIEKDAAGLSSDMRMSNLIIYVMVMATLVGSVFVSRRLQKQLNRMRGEAARLMAEQEARTGRLFTQVATVSGQLTEIAEASSANQASFREMTHAFQEIASGATNQAENTSDITRSVQETSEQLGRINESLTELQEQTERTREMSESGGERMASLEGAISEFSSDIQQMTSELSSLDAMIQETSAMSETIREISRQTNLLALNASIEAARAGESGRGFAVVASEIRKLSDSVGSSADSITDQLAVIQRQAGATQTAMSGIADQMERSSRITNEAKQSFDAVRDAVRLVNQEMADYRERMRTIKEASQSIEAATENFAAISEQSSATIEELAATIQTLAEQNEQSVARLRETDQVVKKLTEM